jgi:hypothetical protein
MTTPETKTIFQDFIGSVCASCGRAKRTKQSHCSACYKKLPRQMQLDLYRKFGYGYEAAFLASTEWLLDHDVTRSSIDEFTRRITGSGAKP